MTLRERPAPAPIRIEPLLRPTGPVVVEPLKPAKKYEDLDGAQGREIFFRPPRYDSQALAAMQVELQVTRADGLELTCGLRDVSQNGVAFTVPDVPGLEVGTVLPRLQVRFDNHEAYDGRARVVSVRTVDGKRVVGASLLDSLMNVDDVLQLRDVKAGTCDLANLALTSRPWHVPGHATFKSLVAEHRLFLEDSVAQLDSVEKSLPWQAIHGSVETPARQALIDRLRQDFVPEFLRFTYETDAALRQVEDEREWDRLRELSLRHLQPFFLQAPIMHRATTKPLGYPGDFEVMRDVYERPFEGPTLFAKAMHLAGGAMAAPQGVRNRKNLMRQTLLDLVARRAGTGIPLRVASVASGPAQEIYETFLSLPAVDTPIEIVLFEQDRLALAFSQARLSRLVDATRFPRTRIVYLHDSIKRLLHDPQIFDGFGPFDLVLCAGLFDYLPMPTAIRLARHLYADLAEGGEAWIGNLVPEHPCRWILEQHLDWRMIYRSHAEMLDMGHAAAASAELRIVEEPQRVNPFVVMRRI